MPKLSIVVALALSFAVPALADPDPLVLRDWPVPFEQVRANLTEREPLRIAERSLQPAVDAVPSAASHFITMVPCRIVDTRNAAGPYGGPMLGSGGTRSYDIAGGPCAGIPSNAAAYSLSVGVTQTESGGFLTAWPSGSAQPVVATMTWFGASQTMTAAAIVPAGTGGSIEVYTAATTHLTLDINGYFVEGVVTSLTAGTGMSGGGTGGVTLGIAAGGVDTNQLASLAVTDAKLATISVAGKVANSATTATSNSWANSIVARDGAGGFAAGALTLFGKVDQTSVDGLVASGTVNSGTIPASGAGVRLMWYPRKAAFRAGRAVGAEWDDDLTGHYSAATGYGTIASGSYSTAMGRDTTANGTLSTAMGLNTTASGSDSTAMGYGTIASGFRSTAMGNQTTASGSYSTAMGSFASTTDAGGTARYGTFVWGDASTATLVRPTANNQFVARAAGGVTFYSSGAMSTGVTLATSAGSWASVSDRERKSEFLPVDGEQILGRMAALPVTSWRYRDDESGRRYIGPVAQDFHALFGLGDDTTLATLDVDGVTLAAVKALEARTTELQAEVSDLILENAALRRQLESETSVLRNQVETIVRRMAQADGDPTEE